MGSTQGFRQEIGERRIGPEAQRQIIELAARLQERDRDHVSELELEQLAEEAGLDREYIREAMRKIESPQPPVKTKAIPAIQAGNPTWFVITATIVCFAWGTVASIMNRPYDTSRSLLTIGLPLAALIGYFAGRRPLAVFFATFLGGMTLINTSTDSNLVILYLCVTALLGLAGCWIRERTFPLDEVASVQDSPVASDDDRLMRLEQLRALRSELESERVRRAFLSVDVVGSFGIKQSLGELEAERLFRQYQRWVQEVVVNHGGEIQSAAGDGAMAMFPNSLSALRAAGTLLRGIGRFNVESGGTIRIRTGISEGLVPWHPNQPIGTIQSPVIDRAAVRQRSALMNSLAVGEELLMEATVEFGSVEALPENGAERIFVVRTPEAH